MRRRWIVLAATMVATLAAVLFGASSPAQSAVADRWGFAFVANPLVPIWTNLPAAQQGGTWPAALLVQGGRTAPGRFLVKFPAVASGARGNVHVTPVNRTGHYCEIVRWFASGADEIVDVQCHQVGGANDDTPFTVLWTVSSGVVPPASGTYASVQYGTAGIVQAFNSTGGAVGVVPAGTGVYQVRFSGVGSGVLSGNVQATAVHPNAAPRRCNILRWGTSGMDAIAYVACRNQAGILVNTEFTASYHRQRSVVASISPPGRFGYVVTNAAGQTNFNSALGFGANSWFATPPVGRMIVRYPSLGFNPTHAQVTAQVDNANYCTLTQPWIIAVPDVQVDVICYNNAGVTTPTAFFSTFTTRN